MFLNKQNISHKVITLLLSTFAMLMLNVACSNEYIDSPELMGTGEPGLNLTVSFYPNVSNDVASRAAGNAIETINSIYVAFFNTDGSLYKLENVKSFTNSTHTEHPEMSTEDSTNGGSWTEGSQARANFRIEGVKAGTYRIYCIANMPLSKSDILPTTDESITAEEKLKNIRVKWDKENIGANNQMFGYFTTANNMSTDKPIEGFLAPEIKVADKTSNTQLHAWIKRAASKVTVAFDPSGLHQNVNIYIHKVTIKDIPAECLIGADNTPTAPETLDATDSSRGDQLILDGESLFFNANNEVTNTDPSGAGDAKTNHTHWMHLTNGSGTKGSDHSATADALFFYENMQGDYKNSTDKERYNKEPKAGWVHEYLDRPDADTDKRPWNYDTKDKINAGTYIEVEGYYNSTNEKNVTSGPIIYRFMLGKNTTYNYNAQRNHHYKVTLCFNGWANQPEWHIEYVEEKPDLKVPPVFYMPYIYNQRVEMPVRWIGDIESLKFEIEENDWGPYQWDPTKAVTTGAMATSGAVNEFAWNVDAWNTYNGRSLTTTTSGKGNYYLGFLALALEKDPKANVLSDQDFNKGEAALNLLKSDYQNNRRGRGPQDIRTFSAEQLVPNEYDANDTSSDQADHYTITTESNSYTLMMPLFTRAKSMIEASGYSGNNPYEYFYRKARLKVTAKFQDGQTKVAYSDVMQVPRITNPKGIWRDLEQTQDFNVTIMTRTNSSMTADFTPMVSDGSWSAEFESGNSSRNFAIVPGPDSYKEEGSKTGKIIGKTNTQMRFTVTFGGAAECAVIIVRYNGDKCVHRIFLRQGYDPMVVVNGSAKWVSRNVQHGGTGTAYTSSVSQNATLVKNPLSFGSYFKRGALSQGIDESNNEKWGHMVDINIDGYEADLLLGDQKSYEQWYLIQSNRTTSTETDTYVWNNLNVNGSEYSLPTYQDFRDLTDYADFGFGIIYTDDANNTQTNYTCATGYAENYTSGTSTFGMRGVIVYNKTNANQIFFPFSKSGFGRRHQFLPKSDSQYGRLLYGDVDKELAVGDNNNIYRPIPYNLPYAPGAIYWIKQIAPKGHQEAGKFYPCAGWDMNYFNFDFNPYTANCLNYSRKIESHRAGSDALPIKLVVSHSTLK